MLALRRVPGVPGESCIGETQSRHHRELERNASVRILCAPASFKGTLTATEVAAAMARGVRAAMARAIIDECPIADGGEGTLDALLAAWQGERRIAEVTGPMGEPVDAAWGYFASRRSAVVELAQAAGLMQVPEHRRDPGRARTHGVGDLIRIAAAAPGVERIIVGLGGSATVDGGAGIAQALGARFLDVRNEIMSQPMCGDRLREVARVDTQSMGHLPALEVACDVTNPLLGDHGAARVFGPQKGATPAMVEELESGLHHLADVLGDPGERPGDSSAGGSAYGLRMMCGATLRSGIELVLEAVNFTERCRNAVLVLTGEGRLDHQSLGGKACMGVAQAAATLGIPVIAVAGSVSQDHSMHSLHVRFPMFHTIASVAEQCGLESSMAEPVHAIEQTVARTLAKWK